MANNFDSETAMKMGRKDWMSYLDRRKQNIQDKKDDAETNKKIAERKITKQDQKDTQVPEKKEVTPNSKKTS